MHTHSQMPLAHTAYPRCEKQIITHFPTAHGLKMDLLQYLLAPSPVSSKETHSRPELARPLGEPHTPNSTSPGSITAPDVLDGTPTSTPISSGALRTVAHATADKHWAEDCPNATSDPAIVSAGTEEICHFWYHTGHCSRDPAIFSDLSRACRSRHSMPMAGEPVVVRHVPARMHRYEFGLEFCPQRQRKDSTVMDGEDMEKKEQKKRGKKNENLLPVETTEVVKAPKIDDGGKRWVRKRKYHPDDPLAQSQAMGKRQSVSYEDLYSDTPPQSAPAPARPDRSSSTSQTTCFFWYHGTCARGKDRRGCPMRHALSDPPTMVKPPPGFVHPKACELEWCPGDGQKRRQRSGADEGPRASADTSMAN